CSFAARKMLFSLTANQHEYALIWLALEFPLVPLQQGLRVVWQKINLTMKLLHFTRLQSAHARVAVQTDDHALKQFLRLVPRHRQQMPIVGGDATNKADDRHLLAMAWDQTQE